MSDKDDETQRRAREQAIAQSIAQAEREAHAPASPAYELAAQSKSCWWDEEETAAWAELNRRRRH